jgi:hypothetical protein
VEAVDPGIATGEDRQRAERHLQRDQRDDERRRAHQLAAVAVVRPHVNEQSDQTQRHEQRPNPVREMNRDRGAPVVGNEMPEHQRKVRNRQSRV